MNETETQRLAGAVNALRPEWPVKSLCTFIATKLEARAYLDAAVALAWVAADPATKTPARVLEAGPWWRATAVADTTYRPNLPPCPDHADQTLPCGRCANEAASADRLAGLERVRAEAEAARRALCPCGTPKTNCADHRSDETLPERETQ